MATASAHRFIPQQLLALAASMQSLRRFRYSSRSWIGASDLMLVRQSTGSAGKGKNLIGLFDESIVSLIGFKILTRSSTLLLAGLSAEPMGSAETWELSGLPT
ncbi:hypothetical protein VTN96DRAFT_6218 [Rasamsonia emersonii]